MLPDRRPGVKVAFYAPFKPLDHPRPSGDQTTALGLVRHLASRGHEVRVASRFRARNLASRPWLWPVALMEALRAGRTRADVWLTHHAYYKSPDVIGPWASRRMGVPYAIFQGIYSTKRRKDPATRLGFELNKRSLLAADVVFSNRLLDMENLRRLLPQERLRYVAPGIEPGAFARDASAREALRLAWGAGDRPVIVTAAMFRDDVKTQGLEYLITRLGLLAEDFLLVLCGAGETRARLEALAGEHLPGRHRFLGQVARDRLFEVFSAGDVFVFPGIRESLGMVYLEAQATGLPVVAFDNGGIPEVVRRGETALLTPPFDDGAFLSAVRALLGDVPRREAMGREGAAYVRAFHDADVNFGAVERELVRVSGRGVRA